VKNIPGKLEELAQLQANDESLFNIGNYYLNHEYLLE
jgi:hypothetical protein